MNESLEGVRETFKPRLRDISTSTRKSRAQQPHGSNLIKTSPPTRLGNRAKAVRIDFLIGPHISAADPLLSCPYTFDFVRSKKKKNVKVSRVRVCVARSSDLAWKVNVLLGILADKMYDLLLGQYR